MIAVGGTRRAGSLAIAVLSGILLRMHHQAVLVAHTRGHAETSHLLTRDLRQRPLRSRYRLRTRREQIAIVLQEPVVLTGSVRENLRYGDGSTQPTDNREGGARPSSSPTVSRPCRRSGAAARCGRL